MNLIELCLLEPSYFQENIVDVVLEANQKSNRIYVYFTVIYKNKWYFLIPFESKLYSKNSSAQFLLPTKEKPKAGLNFEKVLMIPVENQDAIQIIHRQAWRIPRAQSRVLQSEREVNKILRKFERYIENFVKACEKKREHRDHKYRYSTLHHYKKWIYDTERE